MDQGESDVLTSEPAASDVTMSADGVLRHSALDLTALKAEHLQVKRAMG